MIALRVKIGFGISSVIRILIACTFHTVQSSSAHYFRDCHIVQPRQIFHSLSKIVALSQHAEQLHEHLIQLSLKPCTDI
jgi:hypothetical protein